MKDSQFSSQNIQCLASNSMGLIIALLQYDTIPYLLSRLSIKSYHRSIRLIGKVLIDWRVHSLQQAEIIVIGLVINWLIVQFRFQ